MKLNPLTYLAGIRLPAAQIAVLTVFFVICLLLPAGLWDLRGPDEGRYSQVAKELLGRNNWFALTVMGMPYDQKPPLTFWLLAGALKLAGEVSSAALRMPSLLAAFGLLVVTYIMGRRFAGPAAAYLSSLLLLSSISFLDDAPVVELNMLYSFFITASLAVWLARDHAEQKLSWPAWAAMWLLLSMAFLVKGPLAILIVLSAIATAALVRRTRQFFIATRTLPGIILVLAVIGAWLWAQSRAWGAQFVESQVSSETVNRFLKGDHEESFFYYFPRLFTAWMGPWAFLFIAALVSIWRNRGKNPGWVAPLLGWIGIPFLILLLANGKRVPYLLPLLPPACLIAGIWAQRNLIFHPMKKWQQNTLTGLLAVITVALMAAGVMFMVPTVWLKDPRYYQWLDLDRFWPWAWFLTAAFTAALTWFYWKSQRRWSEGIWALVLAILAVHTADLVIVRPAMDPGKSTRYFGETVQRLLDERGESTLLTMHQLAEPEFHVYGDYLVKYVRRKDLDLTKQNLPRVLALAQDEIETSGSAVQAANYRQVHTISVTKKPVAIYVRD